MPMLKTSSQTLRGGRMVKTARGIVSFAPMMAGAMILLGGASAAEAQAVACANPVLNEMCDPDAPASTQTLLYGVSADGAVAAGWITEGGVHRAYRWSAADGYTELGTLRDDDSGMSEASRVSGNGRVIVGVASSDVSYQQAFRWEDGEMRNLGTLREDNSGMSLAYDVSSDGAVIVGVAAVDGSYNTHAFLWVDGIMTDLGTLQPGNAGNSVATGVSADGRVVVGVSLANNSSSTYRAFRWEDGGMIDLGTLRLDGTGTSLAYDVSGNGAVVVGQASSDLTDRAFRWRNGDMEELEALTGTVAGRSMAHAVSADGSVIVGYEEDAAGIPRAVRWTDDFGAEDLGTLSADNSGGAIAYDVSDDGRTIVGMSSDPDDLTLSRAFIYRTTMQDLTNVALSLGAIVEDNAIAVAAQQDTVGQLAEEGFLVARGQSGFRVSGNLLSTGSDNGEGIASGTARSGFLSYGYGVSDQVTLGATIGIFGNSLGTDAVDADNGHGLSLWAEFSQGGLDRTGWQGSAALAWGQQDATIARGLGFTNVTRATGEVELDTRVVHASLGFGVQSGNWLLTPSVGLTHFRSERSGYAETGSDTLASYDKLTMDRTTLTLALEGETRVSAAGRLSLGAGVEHDLSADRARVSGTSDVPGLTTFGFESGIDHNDTRGFVSVGYRHDINENSLVSFDLNVGQAQLGSGVQTGLRVGYQMRF